MWYDLCVCAFQKKLALGMSIDAIFDSLVALSDVYVGKECHNELKLSQFYVFLVGNGLSNEIFKYYWYKKASQMTFSSIFSTKKLLKLLFSTEKS